RQPLRCWGQLSGDGIAPLRHRTRLDGRGGRAPTAPNPRRPLGAEALPRCRWGPAQREEGRHSSLSAFARAIGVAVRRSRNFLWREGHRSIPRDAELHPTVLERFALSGVLMHDQVRPYRPPALRNHRAVTGYWPPRKRAAGAIAAARPHRAANPGGERKRRDG